ncbi:MAG: hypothetical protein JRF29_10150 [Deltaproteobacteria bacterium]|nr:hypothetical protein [Deltaproteobacteria bacterium]
MAEKDDSCGNKNVNTSRPSLYTLYHIGLVKTHGIAFAEVARRLGVSTSAISKIMKRAD